VADAVLRVKGREVSNRSVPNTLSKPRGSWQRAWKIAALTMNQVKGVANCGESNQGCEARLRGGGRS